MRIDLTHFTLLAPNQGEMEMLKRILNKKAQDDVVLRLYTNNKTPAEADVLASYTELSGHGYAARTLTGANWDVTMDGNTAVASFAQVTFTLTGACTCYGYHVSCSGNAKLLYAEKFSDAPNGYVIPSGGGSIKITARLELD